jgi:hypothetical protein
MHRRVLITCAVLALAACPAAAAAQDRTVSLLSTGPGDGRSLIEPLSFRMSIVGARTFFTTRQPLVSDDTDQSADVYAREGQTTTLISRGEGGFNGNLAYDAGTVMASRDGSRVYFVTAEALSHDDNDATEDVYERRGESTVLVSGVPGAVRADVAVAFLHLSLDGSRATFATTQALLPEDADAGLDVYQRDANGLRLLTPGAAAGTDARFAGASQDGSVVFFVTTESLASSDQDGGYDDVYARAGLELRHISVAQAGPASGGTIGLAATAEDGSRAVLFGAEALTTSDVDAANDLYLRDGSSTTHLTTGPAGGNAASNVVFAGASPGATVAYFVTAEALVPGDTDAEVDLYRSTAGTVSLVSAGPTGGNAALPVTVPATAVSGDGQVLFSTDEALVPEDTDAVSDLYAGSNTGIRLISQGEIGSTQAVATDTGRWAPDSSRAYFRSAEAYTRTDIDSQQDVYSRGSRTTLVTPGVAAFDADLLDVSGDGLREFISTREQLTVDDADEALDYYEVRTFPAASNGDPAPGLSALHLSRRHFKAFRARARIAAKRKPRGATLSFTVSEPARVVFQAARLVPGRRVKGRCRKVTRSNRKAKSCKRQAPAVKQRFAIPARSGKNLVRFYGHMGGKRKLGRGRYVFFARAYDSANQRSALRSIRFIITRR